MRERRVRTEAHRVYVHASDLSYLDATRRERDNIIIGRSGEIERITKI